MTAKKKPVIRWELAEELLYVDGTDVGCVSSQNGEWTWWVYRGVHGFAKTQAGARRALLAAVRRKARGE